MKIYHWVLLLVPSILLAQPRIRLSQDYYCGSIPGAIVREALIDTIFNDGDEILRWGAEIEIISEPEEMPGRDDPGRLLNDFIWHRVGAGDLKPGIAYDPGSQDIFLLPATHHFLPF